ncbi:MAG: hypothetical protein ABII72_03480 [Parcubacteria group bacterium]
MAGLASADNQADLEKAILSTIVYFDMFDYPLTAVEIWQGLYKEVTSHQLRVTSYSIWDVVRYLEDSKKIKKYIENKNGFYFLRGRQEIIQTRHQRYLIGQPKWQRAQWITKKLRLVPFVRLIAVCNKIAYNNAGNDSDIDLFIIIKPGRIWTTRTLVTIITGLLGVRRHDRKIKDRVCLSFYITEKAMDLEKLSATKPDTHFMYWITQIAPIFSLNETAAAFWQANKWVKKHLPNFTSYQGVDYQRQIIDSGLTSSWRQTAEKILSGGLGNIIERKLKKLQLKKMSAKTNSARWENNTNVVVSDDILKFHERDARMELRREFLTRLKNIYN